MRRSLVRIEDVADLRTLNWAFWRASRGKQRRVEVQRFAQNLNQELASLSRELLDGSVELGRAHRFIIHDPKRRWIYAPVFRERVLHHALMRFVQPVLERSLVDDVYACRPGRGSLAAALRARDHTTRNPWSVKVDVQRFFDSIEHERVMEQLARRIKGPRVLDLCRRILAAHEPWPGRGLPIGSLTSQHFANSYLAPFDRFLLNDPRVRGMVRYMDDVVWFCGERQSAGDTLAEARSFLGRELGLVLKTSAQLLPRSRGLSLCGFRIVDGVLRLGRRRRQRYRAARLAAEAAYRAGEISSAQLQRLGDVALAITAHASATEWRRRDLARLPPPEA